MRGDRLRGEIDPSNSKRGSYRATARQGDGPDDQLYLQSKLARVVEAALFIDVRWRRIVDSIGMPSKPSNDNQSCGGLAAQAMQNRTAVWSPE